MKRMIRMTAIGATVALVAWTGVWMVAARHIADRFVQWVDVQRAAGIVLAFDSFDVKGWPFGWRAVIANPSASGAGAAGWAWSGPQLVASTDPRDLSRVAFRLPGLHEVHVGAGDLATRVKLRAARPDGKLRFDDKGRVDRLDLDFETLELTLDDAPEAWQVRALKFGLAPHRPDANAPGPTYRIDTLDLSLRADGVRLPAPVEPLASLGRDIASAALDARVQGRIVGTKLAEAV
jgi:hypothetical protein